MITLVLTNRNRDLRIVQNCLQSLSLQSCQDFECVLVDYGSDIGYQEELGSLLQRFPGIRLINCPTQGQLWNKARAINIVLKQTITPYLLVADIDLIFHSRFFEKIEKEISLDKVLYFKVGFLNKEESKKEAFFEELNETFVTNQEATGITLFPTSALQSLNGYDEFYHGWGAEDTDIHIRMKNVGYNVIFYDKELLLKHQWHPKVYRSKQSTHPFHSLLERINHAYMVQTQKTNRTIANLNQEWGKLAESKEYEKLANVDRRLVLTNSVFEIHALLAQLANGKEEVISFEIQPVSAIEKRKNKIRKIVGKKYQTFYELEIVNNLLLETIVREYRNNPYSYSFDRQKNRIQLIMCFQ